MIAKTRKLTAALVAAGVLSAATLTGPVVAQEVSNTGTGTAVFIPYYTINDGWRTLFNIHNTSDSSLAVKVRLHEARNSRDVLDFVVLLSPFDVWTAWIQEGADGQPRLQTNDRSCTVPLSVRDSGASASALAYSGVFNDHSATNNDISRMSEGYIEILVMGEVTNGLSEDGVPWPTRDNGAQGFAPGDADTRNNLTNPGAANFRGSTAWFAKHVNGEPRNCQIIQNDFVTRAGTWAGGAAAIPGEEGSGSPYARLLQNAGDPDGIKVGYGVIETPAPLKVNASLIKESDGLAAGVESLHISDWGVGENLMAAQQFPWFLEPSLASGEGLWTTGNLDDINEGIEALVVANEWANNPNTGASTDWVVTFPTKRFQADEDALNVQAACSIWRNDDVVTGGTPVGSAGTRWWAPFGAGVTPFGPERLLGANCPDLDFPNVFQARNDGKADLKVEYTIFDREEGSVVVVVDGPVISPAPPADVEISSLPYEVNVLSFGSGSVDSALDSLIAESVDTSVLASNARTGWAAVGFLLDNEEAAAYPVTGFIFKKRDFNNPGLNYGQATEHGYVRP